LAKQPFLSHSVPQKILPYLIRFSLFRTPQQKCLQSKVFSLASNTQPGGLGPRIYVPRDRVAQLYPQTLGSLVFAFYVSRGYGGGILTRLHTRRLFVYLRFI
jgi:hypothetical protein